MKFSQEINTLKDKIIHEFYEIKSKKNALNLLKHYEIELSKALLQC